MEKRCPALVSPCVRERLCGFAVPRYHGTTFQCTEARYGRAASVIRPPPPAPGALAAPGGPVLGACAGAEGDLPEQAQPYILASVPAELGFELVVCS